MVKTLIWVIFYFFLQMFYWLWFIHKIISQMKQYKYLFINMLKCTFIVKKTYFLNDCLTKWTPFCFRRIDCSIAMQTVFSSHSFVSSSRKSQAFIIPANLYLLCTYITTHSFLFCILTGNKIQLGRSVWCFQLGLYRKQSK